jgi:hypothetical protein
VSKLLENTDRGILYRSLQFLKNICELLHVLGHVGILELDNCGAGSKADQKSSLCRVCFAESSSSATQLAHRKKSPVDGIFVTAFCCNKVYVNLLMQMVCLFHLYV